MADDEEDGEEERGKVDDQFEDRDAMAVCDGHCQRYCLAFFEYKERYRVLMEMMRRLVRSNRKDIEIFDDEISS